MANPNIERLSVPVGQKSLLVISYPEGKEIAPEALDAITKELNRWMEDEENPIFALMVHSDYTVKLEKVKSAGVEGV